MTQLFTSQQRQTIYDIILHQLKNDQRITGIIVLGTRDEPFSHPADSIDLLVIIEKPSIINIVFTLWVKRLEDLFDSEMSFNTIIDEDLNYVALLLDNYLQIGVQFRSVNRFNLVGTDWCVAFDRKNLIQNYLDKRMKTREQHVQALYKSHMLAIWHPVVGCVRELRRENLWKAVAELEILRKHTVEVAGLRYLEFTQDYRNMSQLPEMFLVQLRHTLPTNITPTAIRRSLKITLGLLFAETHVLDEHYNTSYTQDLKRRLNDIVELYT